MSETQTQTETRTETEDDGAVREAARQGVEIDDELVRDYYGDDGDTDDESETEDEPDAAAMRCTCDELSGELGCTYCEIEVPAFVRGFVERDFKQAVARVRAGDE